MTGKLTILYDESCAFCLRCRDWLLTQPCLVEVELLPAGSPAVLERYGAAAWRGGELVVADGEGGVWAGPAAFVICLWATARYRALAYRLAGPGMALVAERFFRFVSHRRGRWSSLDQPNAPECSLRDPFWIEPGTARIGPWR
jgi:predicted DCC family thiol-disulfide oxidoreductase YuxK